MTTTMTLEKAGQNLKKLVEQLHLGDTITLVSVEGAPLAVLVSLKPVPAQLSSDSD